MMGLRFPGSRISISVFSLSKSLFHLMGAHLSAQNSDHFNLGDIPESCVATILMHLEPPDICNLARLNRTFWAASQADFIWLSKLPPNYLSLAHKLHQDLTTNNKALYSRLCRPNPFDAHTKEAWLDKGSGGVCVSVSSKALSITGIDDRRHWNHITTHESRFQTVAYVQQTWWFQVNGELEFQFPAGTFSLFFRLHLGKPSKRFWRRICNSDHIHGWDAKPVSLHLTTADGQHAASQYYLHNPGTWVLYHVGDFVVHNANKPIKIKFALTQIDCTHTKGGLCVDSVLVYPCSTGKSDLVVSKSCIES